MVTLPLNADADLALDALFALTMVFFDTVHITSAVYCTKVVIFRNTPISFYDNPMSKNRGSSFGSGEDESYFRKKFPCNARRKTSGRRARLPRKIIFGPKIFKEKSEIQKFE